MLKNSFRSVLSGACIGLMLAFPQNSAKAAAQALEMFATGVLPALFPFTACMLLLTAGRAFPLPALLALSMLGGSPTGARLLADADADSALARRIARVTGTMSPMFFLGTLQNWLGNAKSASLLLICHLGSALVFAPPLLKMQRSRRITLPQLSVSAALQQSAQAMLTVGGSITLGSVGARLIACLFPRLPSFPLALLQSLFEVTSGCRSLISAAPAHLLPLLCACTSFSGLSILLQNAAFWGKRGVTLSYLAFSGLVRSAIAFLMCLAILFCLPALFAL